MKKGTRKALLSFLAGAAAGTLTGILAAPEKGSKTRKEITKKVKTISKDLENSLNGKVDELKKQVNEVADEVRDKAQKVEKTINEKVK